MLLFLSLSDISATPAPSKPIRVQETERVTKKPIFKIHLEKSLKRGTQCEVELTFKGKMFNDTTEGLFRSSYTDTKSGEKKWFLATHFRPNLARRVFPCFDEPGYKVPFVISVTRPKKAIALSNMPLDRTDQM